MLFNKLKVFPPFCMVQHITSCTVHCRKRRKRCKWWYIAGHVRCSEENPDISIGNFLIGEDLMTWPILNPSLYGSRSELLHSY